MNLYKKLTVISGIIFFAGGLALSGILNYSPAEADVEPHAVYSPTEENAESHTVYSPAEADAESHTVYLSEKNLSGRETSDDEENPNGNETPDGKEVLVYFDPQNGEEIFTMYVGPDTDFTYPEYERYVFVGWNTNADGTGDFVKNYKQLKDVDKLYGIWKDAPDGSLPAQKKMVIGEKTKLVLKQATGKLTWSSSAPEVVEVDGKGNLTAIKEGKAVISVIQYEKTYECTVTVSVPGWKKAYGVFLSQMKNRDKTTFLLNNFDGKDEPELVVIDKLPITMQNKEKEGTASFSNIGKKEAMKTLSVYKYKKGRVVLMKKFSSKNSLIIMAHRRNGKMMIMDMAGGKTTNHFIQMSNGKVKIKSLKSYRGGEYRIASVARCSDAMIKKTLKL